MSKPPCARERQKSCTSGGHCKRGVSKVHERSTRADAKWGLYGAVPWRRMLQSVTGGRSAQKPHLAQELTLLKPTRNHTLACAEPLFLHDNLRCCWLLMCRCPACGLRAIARCSNRGHSASVASCLFVRGKSCLFTQTVLDRAKARSNCPKLDLGRCSRSQPVCAYSYSTRTQ